MLSGMDNFNRNEELAEYYLRAGVAAVWIEPDGYIGAGTSPRAHLDSGDLVYCCARGAHFVLAYRLQMWKQEEATVADRAAVAAKLEELAEEGGVGLTPHCGSDRARPRSGRRSQSSSRSCEGSR
jgi:hypothetical protein